MVPQTSVPLYTPGTQNMHSLPSRGYEHNCELGIKAHGYLMRFNKSKTYLYVFNTSQIVSHQLIKHIIFMIQHNSSYTVISWTIVSMH